MPELPEVETMVRLLRPRVEGAVMGAAESADPSLCDAVRKVRTPTRVERLWRRGKHVLMRTASAQWIVIHPRMSGRLVWGGQVEEQERTRVRWRFSDGEMRLVDRRRLGTVVVSETAPDLKLGPEPLGGLAWLPKQLSLSRAPVKAWLMDQRNVAGIGNIYASEICFRAEIDPRRPARELQRDEAERLSHNISMVLREAIDSRGTTLADGGYRGPGGELGEFALQLAVYGRGGAPCLACGTEVRRIVQSGRSTFFCPSCQR